MWRECHVLLAEGSVSAGIVARMDGGEESIIEREEIMVEVDERDGRDYP